ncbi:amidohydrolase family protein [Mucilaginibacter sp. HD30]
MKILIKDADFLVTGNAAGDIFQRCSLLIENNEILECPTSVTEADLIIDARGKLVFPGLINTHHHFFQTAFRFVPEMQSAPLDKWVGILCQYALNFNAEDWYNSAMCSLAELALSGCTTTSDHCYLIPNDNDRFFDEEIRAAAAIGMRFHPVRGSMSLEASAGNVFPASVCQPLTHVLSEIQRLSDAYHDPSFGSMCRIAAGPCFPVFPVSSSQEEMQQVAALCRKNGLRFHTHAAEEITEYDYTLARHGLSPIAYLDSIGCLGEDVWLAHCNFLTPEDMAILKKTGTSVSSCPSANSRGAGISRVTEYLDAGIPVSVGVDGAAGNDTSNILSELRMLRTLQGAREGVLASYLINHPELRPSFDSDLKDISYLEIGRLLEVATMHGARALGRAAEIGSIEPGKLADIVIFDDDVLSHAGAVNRTGAVFSCTPLRAWYTIVNGKVIVEEGQLVTADERQLISEQRKTIKRVIQ